MGCWGKARRTGCIVEPHEQKKVNIRYVIHVAAGICDDVEAESRAEAWPDRDVLLLSTAFLTLPDLPSTIRDNDQVVIGRKNKIVE